MTPLPTHSYLCNPINYCPPDLSAAVAGAPVPCLQQTLLPQEGAGAVSSVLNVLPPETCGAVSTLPFSDLLDLSVALWPFFPGYTKLSHTSNTRAVCLLCFVFLLSLSISITVNILRISLIYSF